MIYGRRGNRTVEFLIGVHCSIQTYRQGIEKQEILAFPKFFRHFKRSINIHLSGQLERYLNNTCIKNINILIFLVR